MRARLWVSRIGGSRLSTMARLAMFLARSPMRSSSLAILIAARVSRRSTAIGWGSAKSLSARFLVRCCGMCGGALGDRFDRVGELRFRHAAHLGDGRGERFQFLGEGLDGVVGHIV